MRHILLATAMGTAMIAGPALAQSDSDTGDVPVSGVVAPLCILGAPTPAPVDLGQLAATSGSRIGRVAALGNRTVALPGSFCNFAGSVVSVSVTALVATDNAVPQTGFARAVNYTATVDNWAAAPAAATSAATSNGSNPTSSGSGATQPLPKIADLAVTLSGFSVPADQLLVAGSYEGAVTVTLGPAASEGL